MNCSELGGGGNYYIRESVWNKKCTIILKFLQYDDPFLTLTMNQNVCVRKQKKNKKKRPIVSNRNIKRLFLLTTGGRTLTVNVR